MELTNIFCEIFCEKMQNEIFPFEFFKKIDLQKLLNLTNDGNCWSCRPWDYMKHIVREILFRGYWRSWRMK